MFAKEAFDKLIRDYQFETVLDIGSGAGSQSHAFKEAGKKVTAVDMGKSVYFNRRNRNYDGVELITDNFNEWKPSDLSQWYDVVWCSHILEHQRNPGEFLERCKRRVGPDGLLVVTVPPLKHSIVGGHVTLWNAGLLLYHLVLAGFNCSDAAVKTYGYNITVIVRRHLSGGIPESVLKALHCDAGDIARLAPYFPFNVKEGFDGRIEEVNW